MSDLHSSQALWEISEGEALSLTIGPGQRELSVAEGRLWLTLQGSSERPAQDIWLEPGQSVQLASGSRVVVEAWPAAQFQLLVPPTACAQLQRQRAARKASAAWTKTPSSQGLAAA
jgi:hypothetical protein